jgi:hypothetical protein
MFMYVIFHLRQTPASAGLKLCCLKPTNQKASSRFSALCLNCYFSHVRYRYSCAAEQLNLQTLRQRRFSLDALFPFQVYLRPKLCSFYRNGCPSRSRSAFQRSDFIGRLRLKQKLSLCRMRLGFLWRFWRRRCISNPNHSSF